MFKEGYVWTNNFRASWRSYTVNVVTSVHLVTQKGWPESRASLLRVSYAPNDAPRNETSVHMLTRSSCFPYTLSVLRGRGILIWMYVTQRHPWARRRFIQIHCVSAHPRSSTGMKRAPRIRDWSAREIESDVSVPILSVFSKQQPVILCMH